MHEEGTAFCSEKQCSCVSGELTTATVLAGGAFESVYRSPILDRQIQFPLFPLSESASIPFTQNMSSYDYDSTVTSPIISSIEVQFHLLRVWCQSSSYYDLLFVSALIFLTIYITATAWAANVCKCPIKIKKPLVYPSSIPIFGHLLWIAWDPLRLISSVTLVQLGP